MAAKKPNILVIMSDDIGIWNISAYHRGMMGGRTPNIDRIAREGALFTDSYAQCRAAANDEKSAHSRILLPHEMRIFCRTFLNIAAKYATTHRRCASARREDRT